MSNSKNSKLVLALLFLGGIATMLLRKPKKNKSKGVGYVDFSSEDELALLEKYDIPNIEEGSENVELAYPNPPEAPKPEYDALGEIITINITNNTNGDIPLVSILGNIEDPMDTSNATTQYSWNITGFSVTTENMVAIQYKGSNSSQYSIASATISGNTLQDVINALNTLNLGSFFITTSGGNTFINNYNNNVAFLFLNIFNSNTSSLSYSWNILGGGGKAQIYNNLVLQVSDNSPTTASGSVSVIAGDSILYDYASSSSTTTFIVYDFTTQTYLLNDALPAGQLNAYTFTIQANHSYFLSANDQ